MPDPEAVQRAFDAACGPGVVVWDIGAYQGRYTRLARDAGATVHAFEPAPVVADLRRQFDGDAAVTIHKCALAAATGYAGLDRATSDASTHYLAAGNTVRVRTMDGCVADGIPAPDVCKIDTEGGERDVLAGGARTLRDHEPILFIEVHHDTHGASPTTDRDALRAMLAEAGYTVEVLAAGERLENWRASVA